jgi:hypothetical protein
VRESALARFFLAAYILLVVYASLYPLSGWREPAVRRSRFWSRPGRAMSRLSTSAANFFGYLPFGLLCALALLPASPRAPPACASGPRRRSRCCSKRRKASCRRASPRTSTSCQRGGAACGAAASRWLAPGLGGGPLQRLRARGAGPGAAADLGLTLLGLWLFAQLNPATLLFGTGDLRDLVAGSGERHAAELFVSAEAATAGANLAAVALLASAMTLPHAPLLRLVAGLIGIALLVKTLAFAILMRPSTSSPGSRPAPRSAWWRRGARARGAAPAAYRAPGAGRGAADGATVLVNLSPPNPYFAATLKVWAQGHFLNFNGLTHLVSAAWPFAALVYLVYLAASRRRDRVR